MEKNNQREIIWKFEANKYFVRNKKTYLNMSSKKFPHLNTTQELISSLYKNKKLNIAEVGCANAAFLKLLKKKFKNCDFFGVDPSKLALSFSPKSIKTFRGTADKTNFKKNSMDIIIYGFCLYLCEIEDHNNIKDEAIRILKKNGYIVLYDFYSKNIKKINYKHDKRIKIIKMDFSKIFPKKIFKLIKKKIFYKGKVNREKNQYSIFVLKKK
mgnify:CR=1 FL=1